MTKKRMYDRRKITIFVLAIIGIIFLFKATLNLVIKGKTIDEVSVPVLTAAESKALKKYPNGYHLEVGQIKGIPRAFKSKNEMLQNKSKYIWEYDLAEIKITAITKFQN